MSVFLFLDHAHLTQPNISRHQLVLLILTDKDNKQVIIVIPIDERCFIIKIYRCYQDKQNQSTSLTNVTGTKT